MREERRDITLRLGDVSMASDLGAYYIDMRPARVHYSDGTYGGDFDGKGVPRIGGPDGYYYYPINIAQYGFMLHADWIETGDPEVLQQLQRCLGVLEDLKTEDDEHCVWWHEYPNPRYGIVPPWASAMAQGEAISLYLRLHQAGLGEGLRDSAEKAYRFLCVDVADGGVRRRDEQGNLWLEEYPSEEPSLVLNGFIYALFGLFDLYRVSRDEKVREDIDACLATLASRLHDFDVGYWSLYDLQKRELVRYYYQKNVHVPQLDVLHRLTGDPMFSEYRERWAGQVNPLNYLLVRVMYRTRPRVERLRRWWDGR